MTVDAYAPPMTAPNPPGTLTRKQAAEALGVSLPWFDALVRRGDLTKRGNRLRRAVWFDEREVADLARRRSSTDEDTDTTAGGT